MQARRKDLIAGLSLSGLMLPEAVAYAGIAGLPPERAIFAAIVGCLAYCLVGRSRFAIVTPTSSSAAILAATLASLPGSAGEKAMLITIMVALVGMLFLGASAMRLGNLAGLISRPVLRGFAFGLAITIILKQMPELVGMPVAAPDIFRLAVALFSSVPHWHVLSVFIGITAFVALLVMRRLPMLPGAFLVLALGIAASWLFDLPAHGVAVVGKIELMLAWPEIPLAQWRHVSSLLPYALPLALILFAESWGTIRSLSLRHGERTVANRELGALGLANVAAALVQGMPVGAGFSAGSASETAGAETRATAAIAAFGLAILVFYGSGLVALLPQPVLAAVVIAALTHALDPAPLLRLWQLKRDFYVALAAVGGVMVLGVLDGILVAVALSLAALLRRMASPHAATLGRLGDSHDFVDITRHADAVPIPGISIWRPAQPLFFANADALLGKIAERVVADGNTRGVILSLEESNDLDSTGLDAVLEFDAALRKAGKTLRYARVHDRARDLMASVEPTLLDRCDFSVEDAVNAIRSIQASREAYNDART